MKFYLDEDLSTKVAQIARSRGLDVTSSHELGRDGLDDQTQLELAARDGRWLVTCNRRDFVNLTTMFRESETAHAGVLVVTQPLRIRGASRVIDALAEYDRRHPDGLHPYTFDYLGRALT